MTCLQNPSITDHPEYRNWTPLSGRLKCFEKLRKHLELIYPISKDEDKIETGSFMSFVLHAVQNNPSFASLFSKSSDKNNSNQNPIDVSLLKLINFDSNNSKGRKIYNANLNRIFIEDDLNNFNNTSKPPKDENEVMRKSNNSLKALRNERISQSLNLNKISEIDQENSAAAEAEDYKNYTVQAQNNFLIKENQTKKYNQNNNEELFPNQLYEVYESNEKRLRGGQIPSNINNNIKDNFIKVNEVYNSKENKFINNNQSDSGFNNKNYYKNNNLVINSKAASSSDASQYGFNNYNQNKFNYYNNEINIIEEEERSKKDEEIDLDDIDEKMELNQKSLNLANNNNNYNNKNKNNNSNKYSNNQNPLYKDNIKNKHIIMNENNNNKNNNNNSNKKLNYNIINPKFSEQNYFSAAAADADENESEKLNIVEDDDMTENNIDNFVNHNNNNNNNNISSNNNNKSFNNENALSDLDKEEYFMKSCYDFFDYDITTLAERKVIEDSHPIRTSCFSSKGDYFAIGTNSKSIKLFHIKPVLQRFNKKNSYNFKSDFHQSNNLLYQNINNNLFNNRNQIQNFNNNFNSNEAIDDIKMVFEQANHHMGSIYCLDWSLSGRLIASGSNDRLIKLMVVPSLDESLYGKDYETLELIISGHEGTVRSVCFEPTNDLILLSGGICIL